MRKVLLVLFILFPPLISAKGVPPAYVEIAVKNNIPPALLYAVALTESKNGYAGRVTPWPWTANVSGVAHFYTDRQEAYEHLSNQLRNGNKNFDVGLMQVNWRWNGHRFESLWDATDPYKNIRVGASILSELRTSLGSFEDAVGAYHSPNNKGRADKYRTRVRQELALLLKGER